MFYRDNEVMKLIYVTGPPGSGKSTIQKRLVERSYIAFDIDDNRFGGPVNLETDKRVEMPAASERAADWFDRHEWRISRESIVNLKQQALESDQTYYLCGTASTDHLVWDLFDEVYYLSIDQETLAKRIKERKDNDFGKNEKELELILKRHSEMNQKIKTTHHVSINAKEPVDAIVDRLLAQ